MDLRIAQRKLAKIKMALQGPSGSGKTYSSLLIAKGLASDWTKVAVIDTENHSADLYSHLGNYNVLHLESPFTPERYIEAIDTCEKAGMTVVIIDSISHEWDGEGGILDTHGSMMGNSFTNWSKLTPRHNAFVQKVLQSPCHVICTIRSKQEYALNEKNGKMVPEKLGMKGVTREGMDYEFTLVLDIDVKHQTKASKDRTGLFMDKPEFKINEVIGKTIYNWCNKGLAEDDDIKLLIQKCTSLDELNKLYQQHPQQQLSLRDYFSKRKTELSKPQPVIIP